jgi:hypothetical protein
VKHLLGLSEYYWKREQKEVPIYYEPEKLVNSHLLISGMTGTGKSVQVKRLLTTAADAGVEIDIFDVHEELDGIPGSVAAKYSQATQYGYNPLVLDVDPHAGGVNKQADFVVGLIKQVTTQFGSKQEAALRNLIIDLYMSRGIFPDNQRSWQRQKITEAQRRALIDERKWSDLRLYYPTLSDLLDYAEKKVLTMMFGGDNKAMAALENLCRVNGALQAKLMKAHKGAIGEEDKKKLDQQIAAAEERAIEAFGEAVKNKPNREPKDLIKYDSRDVLVSVVQRLQLLASAGVFNANEPDFCGANVRVHQIKSLSTEQQILFTKLRLREMFERCKQLGPTATGTELRMVALLEEAPKYFTEDTDDIINKVSLEARKFGLGLWCVAQNPTAFPEDFMTSCGAKIILGVDASYWKPMISKMRITEEGLKFIKPKEVIAVKLQKSGQSDPPFLNIAVPNPNSEMGRRVAQYETQLLRRAA